MSEVNGETILEGVPADQAALLGVLNLLHDLGIRIIDVDQVKPDSYNPGNG